jgi:nuclear pore complex protein Nup160
MFSRSTNYSDAFTPLHILKERVHQAIDAEIQNEIKMHDLTEDEFVEVAMNNWEKFYSCCEQYHIAAHQPVGLFVMESLDGVCVIKTSLMTFLRPCNAIENMLLSGISPDEYEFNERLANDLPTLIKAIHHLEKNLSIDVKIEISNNLFKLKMPNEIISNLVSRISCDEDSEIFIPRELIDEVASILQNAREVQTTMGVLINMLRLERNNFNDDDFSHELSIFQKQLFAGCYGTSLVSESVRQISSSRFALCRNLLIIQYILINGFTLNCNEAEIVRSKHIPETVIFLQAYYAMVWIGEDAFATPQAKTNVIGFSSQNGYPQSSSLLQLFVRNKGLTAASKLYFKEITRYGDMGDDEVDNLWSRNLHQITGYIERF